MYFPGKIHHFDSAETLLLSLNEKRVCVCGWRVYLFNSKHSKLVPKGRHGHLCFLPLVNAGILNGHVLPFLFNGEYFSISSVLIALSDCSLPACSAALSTLMRAGEKTQGQRHINHRLFSLLSPMIVQSYMVILRSKVYLKSVYRVSLDLF